MIHTPPDLGVQYPENMIDQETKYWQVKPVFLTMTHVTAFPRDVSHNYYCESWTLQHQNSNGANLIDVYFADVNNGWAAGGVVLHTTDGGATWVSQNSGVSGAVSVYAVSPATAWVGGLQDLGRTTDGGASWAIERPSNTDWFALTFLDADDGWAEGQDQTVDDVPGSIWKRSGSTAAAFEKIIKEERTSSRIWTAPPSSPLTEPDTTR